MKRKGNLAVLVIGLLTVVALWQLKEPVIAATNTTFGDLGHYNAIVRGDYEAGQADSEGAVAIGGNMHAPTVPTQTYSVGAAYAGANGHHVGEVFDDTKGPALLLGGTYQNSGQGLIVKGDLTTYTTNNTPAADVDISGDTNLAARVTIQNRINNMITQATAYLDKAIDYTPGPTIDGSEGYNGSDLHFYTALEDPNVNIGIVEPEFTSEIGEIYIPSNIEDQDVTIIYSPATTIHFLEGATIYQGNIVDINQDYDPDSTISKVIPKVLYYFPRATSITTESKAILGSVFAPNAHLEATGGSVNGQGIFDSIKVAGGFEFHNFSFDWQRAFPVKELNVTKVDAENSNVVLPGVTFRLEDADQNFLGRMTTDADGKAQFTDIPGDLNTVYLVEEAAPDKYVLSPDPIEVDISDTSSVAYFQTVTNEMKPGSVSIQKKIDTPISGEKYDLSQIQVHFYGNGVNRTSFLDNNGRLDIPDLKEGVYSLEEVSAPDNMILNTDVQNVTVTAGENTEFELVNQGISSVFGAWLKKVDSSGQALDGIPFEMIGVKEDGTEVSLGIEETKTQQLKGEKTSGVAIWDNLAVEDFWSKDGTTLFDRVYVIERKTSSHPEVQQDLTSQIPVNFVYSDAIQKMYFHIMSSTENGNVVNKLIPTTPPVTGGEGDKPNISNPDKPNPDNIMQAEILPQTGDTNDSGVVIFGLLSIGFMVYTLRKKK